MSPAEIRDALAAELAEFVDGATASTLAFRLHMSPKSVAQLMRADDRFHVLDGCWRLGGAEPLAQQVEDLAGELAAIAEAVGAADHEEVLAVVRRMARCAEAPPPRLRDMLWARVLGLWGLR